MDRGSSSSQENQYQNNLFSPEHADVVTSVDHDHPEVYSTVSIPPLVQNSRIESEASSQKAAREGGSSNVPTIPFEVSRASPSIDNVAAAAVAMSSSERLANGSSNVTMISSDYFNIDLSKMDTKDINPILKEEQFNVHNRSFRPEFIDEKLISNPFSPFTLRYTKPLSFMDALKRQIVGLGRTKKSQNPYEFPIAHKQISVEVTNKRVIVTNYTRQSNVRQFTSQRSVWLRDIESIVIQHGIYGQRRFIFPKRGIAKFFFFTWFLVMMILTLISSFFMMAPLTACGLGIVIIGKFIEWKYASTKMLACDTSKMFGEDVDNKNNNNNSSEEQPNARRTGKKSNLDPYVIAISNMKGFAITTIVLLEAALICSVIQILPFSYITWIVAQNNLNQLPHFLGALSAVVMALLNMFIIPTISISTLVGHMHFFFWPRKKFPYSTIVIITRPGKISGGFEQVKAKLMPSDCEELRALIFSARTDVKPSTSS